MRSISKKMLISILTSVIVFVTMVATTFAWVGIFTYASTDSFNLNLKVSDLDSNYFLVISSSGKRGTFFDEVNPFDLKKQIMTNKFVDKKNEIEKMNNAELDYFYKKNCYVKNATATLEDNQIKKFEVCDYSITKFMSLYESTTDYFKFDIYLSVDTKEGIQEFSEINSSVFFDNIEKTLSGSTSYARFSNGNPFGSLPSSDAYSKVLKSIPNENFKINSANASRFALSIYEPINIDDEYSDEYVPVKTLIYQGGSQHPEYNESTQTYDLGGCLPEDYNSMAQELKTYRPNYSQSAVPEYKKIYFDSLNNAINRGDLELKIENSQVWNKVDDAQKSNYLGVANGIQTKMKISVYFWFEGWDSDCIKEINELTTQLDLVFTAGINN